MAAQIAHVLFIDIVAWSKGSMEAQALEVSSLTEALRRTEAFRAAESSHQLGLIPAGDGMAVLFFGDLTGPVNCALQLRSDLNLRMGMHSGPVQSQVDVTGKENYVGDGVNMAKRVLDMAEPGEVLMSGTYAQWLSQFDEWKDKLVERGEGTAKHGVQIQLFTLQRKTEVPLELDTGGVPPDSRYYIERASDPIFHRALTALEPILLVKGPRQIGKTSLLSRGVVAASRDGRRTAFTDFQKFGGALLASDEAFYKALAATVGRQIGFAYDFGNEWDPIFGATMNMEGFLRAALEADPRPLVWMMDEADKLFGLDFASDFYGLVRSWHNSRATDPTGPWGRLSIVIAYATEAHLFIQDLNQSPFNVGRRIDMEEFTAAHVTQLNERLGRPLSGADEVNEILGLVGGHPFLIRRALNVLCSGTSLAGLIQASTANDGPFGDHLKRVFESVTRQPEVTESLRQVLAGKAPTHREAVARLSASGVFTTDDQAVRLRNRLYEMYLTKALA